ncbi:MAG TPA: hypothetical protein VNH65_14965 [Candidatus Acidoferrum sp.]|nr:hypothetical protein [Candidatus Acidoferrum sp.]
MRTKGNPFRGLAVPALLFSISAVLGSQLARAQIQVARVTVQTEPLGGQIPKDFAGFSLEVSTAGQGIGAFAPDGTRIASTSPMAEYALGTPTAPNEAFFQFMQNLGSGILRLGGNSQDNTCWNPAAAPHPDRCKGQLSAGDFQLFSRAAKASGWRLIIGLNLKQNSSQWALDEVTQAIAQDIKPEQIFGLELGNEPDLFSRDGGRPATYTPTDHVRDFLAYRDAFEHNPIARKYALIGPATCCAWRNAGSLDIFLDGVGASNLKLATVHSYLLTTCGGRKVSMEELLAPALMTRFRDETQSLVTAAHKRQLQIALAETNSASCGGMPGVSNAFAAALWGIDSLFSAAEAGFSAVNFHFSYRPGGSSYNPVDTYERLDNSGRQLYQNIAQPLYYGMYLFARSAAGEYFLPASTQTESNIRSYATTACSTCAVNIVIINKDASASGRVRVHIANRAGMATLLLLRAPKLGSFSQEVTYGGARFSSDGHIPAPHTQQIKSDAQGSYDFDLPNSAAAVLAVPGEESHSQHY